MRQLELPWTWPEQELSNCSHPFSEHTPWVLTPVSIEVFMGCPSRQTRSGMRKRGSWLRWQGGAGSLSPQGADHLPPDLHRGRDRQPGHRPDALPGGRGSRQGHPALHQLPRRLGDGGHRHLRHHAVSEAGHLHHLHGAGGVYGRAPALGYRCRGGAVCAWAPGAVRLLASGLVITRRISRRM